MTTQAHPAFEFLRSERIDSLNIDVAEYRHRKTGAQHIHITADNPEKVSGGIAHRARGLHRGGPHTGTHRPLRQ